MDSREKGSSGKISGGRVLRRSSGSVGSASGLRRGRGGGSHQRSSHGHGDMKEKLERSRQSARECRARKKLRYQYLEELVASREKAIFSLRKELDQYREWAADIEAGRVPEGFLEAVKRDDELLPNSQKHE
ncbi:unnamed protein product [Darwinula stevensoni]|uniref:BZIP domain-containing protein n=1 Tax=Darwinula stevensoni TaxID=69355 RepID=A0A7R8X9B6_9CRUS|nr:unnamed protein product [Darwinula stevensoni]CAG0882387.1 unnamed protein product [Darwinula stevensoni]